MKIYRTHDADPSLIKGKRVAIIGYGNQGRAHALNLRDRGADIVVGIRAGASDRRAGKDGFSTMSASKAITDAAFIALLIPDLSIGAVINERVLPSIAGRRRPCFVLAHGYSLLYGNLSIPDNCDAVLVAPLGPGTELRARFLDKSGLPCWLAVHQDATGRAKRRALAYAWAIGSLYAGAMETTVEAETHCDLFGEQAVLVGGLLALASAGYRTLVEAGFPGESAYLETAYQLRSLAELLERYGPQGMLERVSQLARIGSLRHFESIESKLLPLFRRMLTEIQSGRFSRAIAKKSTSHLRGRGEAGEGSDSIPTDLKLLQEVLEELKNSGIIRV